MRKYNAVKHWVIKTLGKPRHCVRCGRDDLEPHRYHWVSKSGNDVKEADDWLRLCAPCHWQYDAEKGRHTGLAYCKNGHALTEDNIYNRPGRQSRNCRACARIATDKWLARRGSK